MKKKLYPISKEELSKLPIDIINKTMDILKCYDECHIIYQYGKYEAGTCVCLLSKYPEDFKAIGTVYVDDIYTLDEQTENYMESFHDYPIWYKGKRDYKALKEKYGKPANYDNF